MSDSHTTVDLNGESKNVKQREMIKVDQMPSLSLTFLFGFQQVMVCVSALLTIPFILTDSLCPGDKLNEVRVKLISATFVTSGISTIIQSAFGFRLALLQGVAFAYVPTIEAYFKEKQHCNLTINDYVDEQIINEKMAYILGSLMISSFIPFIIGITGMVGKITKYIGPLTIASIMLCLVISSVNMTVNRMEKHWVAIIQAGALFITILYLANFNVKLPFFKNGKIKMVKTNIFSHYPYLIAIIISWVTCVMLTVTNLVPPESEARTDKNSSIAVIVKSPWVRIPYPGMYGPPKFDIALILGFIVSAMTSVFESIGDYHAAARVSEERSPPSHAINRGIMAEACGSFLSSLLGPGAGITTHTENIGVMGVTRVASRYVMCFAGCLLIILGIFTKVGAILSTIPDPLVGGVLASSMAMVAGVAISNLQQVDMQLSRNMTILGFSIMTGIALPEYFRRHKLHTNSALANQVLQVLLTLEMFIGGLTACILDNTVPGASREQRGLRERGLKHDLGEMNRDVYYWPNWAMEIVNKYSIFKFLPFVPKEKILKNNHVSDIAKF
uniref:SLC26A/SulP transporter domain-containing protein n=1 Tax=Strongyloides stercoralis TaxID=6248 RepID=A0A0K0E8Q5_STRER